MIFGTPTAAVKPLQLTDPSRAIARKALTLPVRNDGDGVYSVASGSEVGKTYRVQLWQDGGSYCNCVGTRECSHIWAVRAAEDADVRRQLRVLAAPKPRARKGGAA